MGNSREARAYVRLTTVVGTLLFCLLGVVLLANHFPPARAAGDSPLLLRIYYEDIGQLSRLGTLDIWENNLNEGYVLAASDALGYEALLEDGWFVEVDREAMTRLAIRSKGNNEFFAGYQSVDELYDRLESFNLQYPDLTELYDYGISTCMAKAGCLTPGGDEIAGYALRALRITNEKVPGSSILDGSNITRGSKPVFFLMANIHAREITVPELAVRYIDLLLADYGIDPDITWLVDHHEIWVVPTVNPDGHRLVELGGDTIYGGYPFFQRKNANQDANGDGKPDCAVWPPQSYAQYGIDLNRNHTFGWGPPGSSDHPCDLTYRGPSPGSELEVNSLERFITALIPDQRGPLLSDPAPKNARGILITLHSYGNLVLWPWGHIFADAPNHADLKAIGDRLADFNGYYSCRPTECLYASNGSSDDWAYGVLGIPAFTFEIGDQFMPPYSEIDGSQWPDNAPALVYAAKIARSPYQLVHGPETGEVELSMRGNTLEVRAIGNDRENGDQTVVAVIYSIGLPPWDPAATPLALKPEDGNFDSSIEAVSGTASIAGLPPGKHMVYLQSRDVAGHWGVVTAAFFEKKQGDGDTGRLTKSASDFLVIPGTKYAYRIDVFLRVSGTHTFSIQLSDQLPAEVEIIPDSVTVNDVPSPGLYDPESRSLHFQDSGELINEYTAAIRFEVSVPAGFPAGQIITNQAAIQATIDGLPVPIPAASVEILTVSQVRDVLLPIVAR